MRLLLYRWFLREVEQKHLDKDEEAALDWLARCTSRMAYVGKSKRRLLPLIPWTDQHWQEWRHLIGALRRLDEDRRRGRPYNLPALSHADIVIVGTENHPWAMGEQKPEDMRDGPRGIRTVLKDEHGNSTWFPCDARSFWQAVFLSFFDPGSTFERSVCSRCGKELPQTKQLKKKSKARFCSTCRVAVYRAGQK